MLLRKPVFAYYMKLMLRAMMWFGLVYTAIFLLAGTGLGIAVNIGTITTEGGTFGGMDAMFAVMMFIFCMSDFAAEFHFLFQHGVSRRSAFVGFVFHVLVVTALFAAVLLVSATLFGVIGAWIGVDMATVLFDVFYGSWLEAAGTFIGILLTFLFYWAALFMAGMLGYLLSILLYRLDKFGKILLGAAGVVLVVALPVLNTLTNGRIWQFAVWLGETFFGRGDTPNPLNGIAVFAAGALIALVPSWLLIRRVKLKK